MDVLFHRWFHLVLETIPRILWQSSVCLRAEVRLPLLDGDIDQEESKHRIPALFLIFFVYLIELELGSIQSTSITRIYGVQEMVH